MSFLPNERGREPFYGSEAKWQIMTHKHLKSPPKHSRNTCIVSLYKILNIQTLFGMCLVVKEARSIPEN